MEYLGGFVLIGAFVLVLFMGAAVLLDRITYGRKAVQDAPGWQSWGAHIIVAFVGLAAAGGIALYFDFSVPVRGVVCMTGLVGGYFIGIWFVGHGKDPT